MKTKVDNDTGILILIPESEPDKRLLYHLMNCSDMRHFSEYLEISSDNDITTDLGIEFDQFDRYLETVQPVVQKTDTTGFIGQPIGFDRDRYGECVGVISDSVNMVARNTVAQKQRERVCGV